MKNGELCKFNPYFFYTLGSEAMFAYAALLPSAAPTDPTSQSQCDMQVSPDASSDLRVLKCHARKNGYVPAIVTCCSAAPSTVLRFVQPEQPFRRVVNELFRAADGESTGVVFIKRLW